MRFSLLASGLECIWSGTGLVGTALVYVYVLGRLYDLRMTLRVLHAVRYHSSGHDWSVGVVGNTIEFLYFGILFWEAVAYFIRG